MDLTSDPTQVGVSSGHIAQSRDVGGQWRDADARSTSPEVLPQHPQPGELPADRPNHQPGHAQMQQSAADLQDRGHGLLLRGHARQCGVVPGACGMGAQCRKRDGEHDAKRDSQGPPAEDAQRPWESENAQPGDSDQSKSSESQGEQG